MPEAVPIIPAGSSAQWNLTIKNVDDTLVDPTASLGYAIYLFDSKGKIIKKYSKNLLTGFVNTLSNVGTDITMLWEGSETKDFPAGEIWFQYFQQTTNPTFTIDTKFNAKTIKKRLCIIEESESKHTSSLV
jgi:hypothetical protein